MTYPRFQLSLLVPPAEAVLIEEVRQVYNPLQKALIPAHTTLCREDEIQPLQRVLGNLMQLPQAPLTVGYGQPSRFHQGKGLWLPSEGNNEAFAALRKRVLQGVIAQPRPHFPHLTLIHPRNGTCTDAIFEAVQRYPWPTKICFTAISLIEQTEEGAVWQVRQAFSLTGGL